MLVQQHARFRRSSCNGTEDYHYSFTSAALLSQAFHQGHIFVLQTPHRLVFGCPGAVIVAQSLVPWQSWIDSLYLSPPGVLRRSLASHAAGDRF